MLFLCCYKYTASRPIENGNFLAISAHLCLFSAHFDLEIFKTYNTQVVVIWLIIVRFAGYDMVFIEIAHDFDYLFL